ncbi:hypothetical protein [Pseudarthrobacter sp. IC2-21]|uniref:hypothetical protein n=1 Tax=Pseudarthrobacter sp. IC2-21 TaxID=3092262 RepID=UPI002A6B6C94|nr:hypothetical protein [Pseudarthrobacter sp. IC2-21]
MPRQPKKSQDPAPDRRPGGRPLEGSVSHSESDQTPEEILAYWTPERMAAAKPRELRLPDPAPGAPDDDADPDANHS